MMKLLINNIFNNIL